MLLNIQRVIKEVKGEIKKYLKTNENRNATYQNLQDAAKVVLRGKFISTQAYLKTQEKSQVNNLTWHLKKLEKEQSPKLTEGKKKEILDQK